MEQAPIWDRVERVTKISAVCVLSVYVLGFLVTSLYYSTLGIAPINPLRPRVIGAGLLLTLTAGMGYWAGVTAFSDFLKPHPESGANQLPRLLVDTTLLVFLCSYLSVTLWQMTDFDPGGLERALSLYIAPTLLFVAGSTIRRIHGIPQRSKQVAISVAMALSLLAFAISFSWPHKNRSGLAIIGWLLFISVTSVGAKTIRQSESFSAALNVTSYVSQIVLLLTFFPHYLYPHFLPEWGGGSPVPITMTFNKEAGYLAGDVKPALLLDESDLGFYLLDRNLKRTYFVPRSSVSLVAYQQRVALK